jgi:hypothetical protein
VVQASNNEAVTPASPPAEEVPGPGEESPETDAAGDELPVPVAGELPAETDASTAADDELSPEGPDQLGEAYPEEQAAVGDITAASFSGDGQNDSGDMPTRAAAAEGRFEEAASSTSWRSFTAAERQRREARP